MFVTVAVDDQDLAEELVVAMSQRTARRLRSVVGFAIAYRGIEALRFYCVKCQQRFPSAGMCGNCVDEPLLNLAEEQTWLYLEEEDGRARQRRYALAVAASMPVGIALFAVVFLSAGMIVGAIAASAATAGLAAMIAKLFPPKRIRPVLTSEEFLALKAADTG